MEMKFYELIGVKQWKKFVLWIMALFIRNPKERRGGNYYLEKINLGSIKKFKKQLHFNASIHIVGAILCLSFIVMNLLSEQISIVSTVIQVLILILNLYCIMLQRYNWLRIKKILDRAAFK